MITITPAARAREFYAASSVTSTKRTVSVTSMVTPSVTKATLILFHFQQKIVCLYGELYTIPTLG